MAEEARDDEREALDYVIALNEHAEEQFSRGVESAHGYDEDSFIAGVRWVLARKHPEPEWEYMSRGRGGEYIDYRRPVGSTGDWTRMPVGEENDRG